MADEKDLCKSVAARFAGFDMWAMSSLRSKATGIEGVIIWVSTGEFAGADLQHGPRVKVVLGDKVSKEKMLKESVTIKISESPEVLDGDLPGKVKKQVIGFVKKNREVLLQYWNEEIDTQELIELLEKV